MREGSATDAASHARRRVASGASRGSGGSTWCTDTERAAAAESAAAAI
jgi:hypothetical protein